MPKSIAAVPTSGAACTFHDYSARSPDRAATVRAHDGVVVGALLPRADQPAYFLPTAGLLYFRKTQLPAPQEGPPIASRARCGLLVELGRRHAEACTGKHLLAFDGGFAPRGVVRRLVESDEPGQPRIEFLTRLRHDARLCALPSGVRRPGGAARRRSTVGACRLPGKGGAGRGRGRRAGPSSADGNAR